MSVSIYTCLRLAVPWSQAQRQRNGVVWLVLVSALEGEASKISTESLVQMSVLSTVTMENSVSNMVAWGCGIQSCSCACFDLHSSSFNLLPPI